MMTKRYFYVHWHEDDSLGMAWAPDNPALDVLLAKPEPVQDWTPISFTLREGAFADYQANALAIRLCSKKFMDAVEGNRAEGDAVQWLPSTLTDDSGETRAYCVLHIAAAQDVLDKKRTLYAGGDLVVRACLDESLVANHSVLGLPGCVHSLIVDAVIREALESVGCSGLEFSRVLTNSWRESP